MSEEKVEEYTSREKIFHLALVSSAGVILLLNLIGLFKKIFFLDTAFIVALIWGIPIYWTAIKGIFDKKLVAEVLVTVAAIASMSLGQFLVAGEVIFIMLIGETLEAYAVDRTRISIKEIMDLTPKTARVRRGEKEIEIPIEAIKEGDLIIVKPGERIPVDGIITSGSGAINQAPITGESIPINKAKGGEVYTGSLVELGMLEINTTKVGKDTTLAKVVELTEAAQERKGHIQRIADWAAKYFVITVLSIALLVYILTTDILIAAIILIIACPCALVLATPTAVVAAVGNAAKRGILIKGGVYLETLGKADTLVIDKTGTVTIGEPKVTDIIGFGKTQHQVLSLAGICERFSEHALAKAIIEKAEELKIRIGKPDRFEVIPGLGVVAINNKRKILVGNKRLLSDQKIKIKSEIEESWNKLESQGKTVMAVVYSSKIYGLIGVADILRQDAKDTFKHLNVLGLNRIIMLTGDNPKAAKRIADQIQIDEVKAELLPEDKISVINRLKKRGFIIIMVGDGINDAPALSLSDVGIAMGAAGADTAIEASNIVFMSNDLINIDRVIRLGRRTLQTIRQNIIYFALLFNGVGILLGSLGLLTPVIAAIAHQFSSLFVILNSLRLLRYR